MTGTWPIVSYSAGPVPIPIPPCEQCEQAIDIIPLPDLFCEKVSKGEQYKFHKRTH